MTANDCPLYVATQITVAAMTDVGNTSGRVPRTLAEDLRARDDDALSHLLLARPDLARPAPVDMTQLASRVG
ncbi:MAG: hypothetical protein H0V23_08110, partial [Nocardioidaceae bacterium]|nr:hypothetical protein [Nocardioidaceae bacterium]